METICRLVRVLQCPHECGHALLISQGSPGMSTNLAQLAAHLCGYSVFRINSSALSASDRYTLESFKGDLVSAYTRAGVKVTESLLICLSPSIPSVYFPIVRTFFRQVFDENRKKQGFVTLETVLCLWGAEARLPKVVLLCKTQNDTIMWNTWLKQNVNRSSNSLVDHTTLTYMLVC